MFRYKMKIYVSPNADPTWDARTLTVKLNGLSIEEYYAPHPDISADCMGYIQLDYCHIESSYLTFMETFCGDACKLVWNGGVVANSATPAVDATTAAPTPVAVCSGGVLYNFMPAIEGWMPATKKEVLKSYTDHEDARTSKLCAKRCIEAVASGPHLDLDHAPYVLYGVKYIDLVPLDVCVQAECKSFQWRASRRVCSLLLQTSAMNPPLLELRWHKQYEVYDRMVGDICRTDATTLEPPPPPTTKATTVTATTTTTRTMTTTTTVFAAGSCPELAADHYAQDTATYIERQDLYDYVNSLMSDSAPSCAEECIEVGDACLGFNFDTISGICRFILTKPDGDGAPLGQYDTVECPLGILGRFSDPVPDQRGTAAETLATKVGTISDGACAEHCLTSLGCISFGRSAKSGKCRLFHGVDAEPVPTAITTQQSQYFLLPADGCKSDTPALPATTLASTATTSTLTTATSSSSSSSSSVSAAIPTSTPSRWVHYSRGTFCSRNETIIFNQLVRQPDSHEDREPAPEPEVSDEVQSTQHS